MNQTAVIFVCAVLALGGCSPLMAAHTEGQHSGDRSSEGEPRTVKAVVEYMRPEANGRVPVALAVHAQLFFVDRQDKGFDQAVRLLEESRERKQPVTVIYLNYSGRIVAVAE